MEIIKIKNFVKRLLKGRLFLGHYMERRLVNVSIGYRDIVLISNTQTDLKRDLLAARYKLRSVYNKHWIGISDDKMVGNTPGGVFLWTEIENKPFGQFWFQIKSIKFRCQEIIILLKRVRYMPEALIDLNPTLPCGEVVTNVKHAPEDKLDNKSASLYETYSETIVRFGDTFSISNVKEFLTFIIAFIIAIFTGSTAFINFLGNFVLALVREMSILIKNLTPVFISVLDFMAKVIEGFYIFLAMFFKPSDPVSSNSRYTRPALGYDQQRHSSTYDSHRHYNDRSFD